jgi:hypothetical protein
MACGEWTGALSRKKTAREGLVREAAGGSEGKLSVVASPPPHTRLHPPLRQAANLRRVVVLLISV